MAWWVYKCNSKGLPHQSAWGDWNDFFQGNDKRWGNTQWVPALGALNKGDKIIAYQTDRNELVGIVEVSQSCAVDGYLYLQPIEIIGVKVRPLKTDPNIAAIPAFKPGPIKTLYEISSADAERLLKAAGSTYQFKTKTPKSSEYDNTAKENVFGGGFGNAEKNAEVEKVAIAIVKQKYKNDGWKIQSVEQQKQGFDLLCRKGNKEEHVEVKGISGSICSFIVTANEVKQAERDSKFVLWAVTNVLSKTPATHRYTAQEFLNQFALEPLQYKASLKNT